MKKVFMVKGVTTPEDYLKNMLDCIGENGELNIAREIDEVAFCTAESEETATHIEKVNLDTSLADYDSVYSFYENALSNLDLFIAENSPECNDKPYRNRMLMFAKRIKRCYEINVPDFFLIAQKCMFIDSVLLYTTNAIGEFVVNKK